MEGERRGQPQSLPGLSSGRPSTHRERGSRRRHWPAGMWEEGEFWTYSVGLFLRKAELSPSKDRCLSNWRCPWLQAALSRELHFNSCQGL